MARQPIITPQATPGVVQQPNVPAAGTSAINRGLGQLAGGIRDLDDYLVRREQIEGETWAAQKLAEARGEWAKATIERENAVEGDPVNYATTFDRDFASYTANLLKNAPNRHARDRLQRGLTDIGGRLGANARVFEATRRVAHRADMVIATVNSEVNSVLSDASLLGDALENVETLIDVSGLPGDKRAALLRSSRSQLAEAHIRALLRTDPMRAMENLNNGTFDAMLDPGAKEQLLRVARPAAGRALGAAAWDTNSNANIAAALRTGSSKDIADAIMPTVIWQESRGRTGRISPKGALGIAQMMPGTAKAAAARLGVAYDREKLLHDPEYGAMLGKEEMRHLLERYDNNIVLALAAYNAGPGNVDKWLDRFGDPRSGALTSSEWAAAIPLAFKETREYILGRPGDPSRPGVLARFGAGGAMASVAGVADPVIRDNAEREIASKEAEAAASREVFLEGFKDELAFLAAGNAEPEDSKFTRDALVEVFNPARGQELYDLKMQAIMEGEIWSSIRMAPPGTLASMREHLVTGTKDPAGFENAVRRLKMFDDLVRKRNEAIRADPAGYVLAAIPKVAAAAANIEDNPEAYAQAQIAAQENLGVSNPQVLTKDQAQSMAAEIGETESHLLPHKLVAMRNAWGTYYPDVLRELRAAGVTGATFVAAAYADQPGLAQQIVASNRAGEAELKKGVKPADVNALRKSLDEALAPYQRAFAAGAVPGEAVDQFNEVRETMHTWALAQLRAGNTNAADDAITRFMGSKFLEPIDNGRVHALVPNVWDGSLMTENKVTEATDALQTEDAIRKFDPAVIGSPGVAGKESTIQTAINSGLWVASDDNDGLMLMVPDKFGVMVPLMNEQGALYVVPFGDIVAIDDSMSAADIAKTLIRITPITAPLGQLLD